MNLHEQQKKRYSEMANEDANKALWNQKRSLEEENALLKKQNEVLLEMQRTFYMDICRAYNAGKLNAFEMVAEGKKMGESLDNFKSSHDYFIGEFPTFKTNVP